MLVKRLVLGVILLGSLFWLPWWITLILGLVGFIVFKNYYEGAAFALLFDLIYGAVGSGFWGFPLPFFLGAIVLLLILPPLKYRLWYSTF